MTAPVTAPPPVTPKTIRDIVAPWAQRASDAPAILAPGRPPLTYGCLLDLIDETISRLRFLGIAAHDRVAVILPNGPEAATAFFSIASGAACAPLNPACRESELDFFLTDLQAKAIVIHSELESPAARVAEAKGIVVLRLSPVLAAGAGAFKLDGSDRAAPARPELAAADDVALLLHTSGTTARPKLVPLLHRSLCASAGNICRTFLLTPADRCLNVMPLFHVHGLIGAALSSVTAGASLVCTPGFLSPKFFDWVREFRPTWYTAVPTMHQSILARARAAGENPAACRLRFIRSCSAALLPTVLGPLEAAFQSPVVESYGMTEASHQLASSPLPPATRKPGSVGVPTGPEIAIMDEAGALLPPRSPGEVVVRGETVMRGYIADASVNEKAFTNGWFRTGDEGFLDGEGYLFLKGRIKELINRGGEKIFPLEIDEALLKHPGVAQAVSFAVPHAQLGEEVGVAIVPTSPAALTEREVRLHAASILADFKVPRVVRFVTEIPQGPTGKIQRVGLAQRLGVPAIDLSAGTDASDSGLPRTELEKTLAGIWCDVLGIAGVRVGDNFFRSGGDSVLATQFVTRVSEQIGGSPALVEFLEEPSISATAARIEEAGGGRLSSPRAQARLIPIQRSGANPPFFCVAGHDGDFGPLGILARAFGPEQPFFGFAQPPVRDARFIPRLEEIVAGNIETLRAHQPAGPYRLLGWCFGGCVVYEMARQLQQQGQTVALLAMFDCYNPAWPETLSAASLARHKLLHAVRRVSYHARRLRRSAWKENLEYVTSHAQEFLRVRSEILVSVLRAIGAPVPRRFSQPRFANRLAVRRWTPGPYAGAAILFRSAAPRAGIYPSPLMGWEGLIMGGIEVLDAPDTQGNLRTQDNLRFIVRSLRGRLPEPTPSLR